MDENWRSYSTLNLVLKSVMRQLSDHLFIDWFLDLETIFFAESIDTYIPSNLFELLHIFTQNWLHNKFPKSTQVRNWPSLPSLYLHNQRETIHKILIHFVLLCIL